MDMSNTETKRRVCGRVPRTQESGQKRIGVVKLHSPSPRCFLTSVGEQRGEARHGPRLGRGQLPRPSPPRAEGF